MRKVNIANQLTYFRLAAIPFFLLAFYFKWYAAAFALFTLAGISDLVDGYIARRFNLHTPSGAILDPIADKLLMAATFISLGTIHFVPWWFVVLMLVKDLFILAGIGYFRFAKIPFTYSPLWWSKVTTLLLICMGAFALLDLTFPGIAIAGYPLGDFVFAGIYFTGIFIVVTTLEYLRQGLELLAKRPS